MGFNHFCDVIYVKGQVHQECTNIVQFSISMLWQDGQLGLLAFFGQMVSLVECNKAIDEVYLN